MAPSRLRSWFLGTAVLYAMSFSSPGQGARLDEAQREAEFTKRSAKLRDEALRNLEPRVIVPRAPVLAKLPWKANIVCAVYAIGERNGRKGSTAWDPEWQKHYGGYDDPTPSARHDYAPAAFTPRLNPFYIALPYNDLADGTTKPEARRVIPWFLAAFQKEGVSVCRDRWLAIKKGDRTCYAQWNDCGPHESDHWQYVFGPERPRPNASKGAGILASPAVRDYLGLSTEDLVDWKFVESKEVPAGPWMRFGTQSLDVDSGSKLPR